MVQPRSDTAMQVRQGFAAGRPQRLRCVAPGRPCAGPARVDCGWRGTDPGPARDLTMLGIVHAHETTGTTQRGRHRLRALEPRGDDRGNGLRREPNCCARSLGHAKRRQRDVGSPVDLALPCERDLAVSKHEDPGDRQRHGKAYNAFTGLRKPVPPKLRAERPCGRVPALARPPPPARIQGRRDAASTAP